MQLSPDNWVVLVVDDHFDNVMVAKTTLEFHGAEVHVAKDGRQGLAVLQALRPTIILLDLSMPNMNGWELLKHIQAMPALDDVPVVAVTAHAMDYDRGKVLAAGFDDYLSKPYDIDKLMEFIEETIQRKTVEA